MKVVITILIVLAVLLAIALIWTAMKRKQERVGRERASELRSDAATTAAAKKEQEARAREAEAEAERVRAQADKLEVHAQEERTSYDMTRAQQEDSLRAADRVDPDVDHRAPDYQPDLDGSAVEHPEHHLDEQSHDDPAETRRPRHSTGPANPVPTGPETIVPEQERRDQV